MSRLQQIKLNAKHRQLTVNPPIDETILKSEDYDWLIQQAEQVHKLLNHIDSLGNVGYGAEERYKQALENISIWHNKTKAHPGSPLDICGNIAREALDTTHDR